MTKKGTVGSQLKAGAEKKIVDGDKAHKIMMTKMNELFKSNHKFKLEFAREAMSGNQKFGKKSNAAASHILVSSFNGEKVSFHNIDDDSYVNKVVEKMNLSVRFKSASQKKQKVKTGKYHYWSVIGLVTAKMES